SGEQFNVQCCRRGKRPDKLPMAVQRDEPPKCDEFLAYTHKRSGTKPGKLSRYREQLGGLGHKHRCHFNDCRSTERDDPIVKPDCGGGNTRIADRPRRRKPAASITVALQ